VHFGLSEEQELLQETLRGFARSVFPAPRLREVFDAGTGHDDAVWRGLVDLGIPGLLIPEEHGGAGLEILELALVCEVAGGAALPGAILEHALAAHAIALAGSEAQRKRWLPRLASGETIATVAFGEARPGGDAWRPEEWSVRRDGGTLSGEKSWVPHVDRAGLIVVGLERGALAVLEGAPGAIAGVERLEQEGIDRTRPIGRLRLERAEAEPLARADAALASRVVDAGLVGLAADAFGAGTKLVELCVAYAKDRRQFGFPIAQFQAVKHQIARMGTDVEPTRALFWYAAHALDRALPDAARHAALAKGHISDRVMSAARQAVELHGGLGFTWECEVQIWFKRAMYDRGLFGTPETQRERMAALAGW
jgi:alkylation response protein AidB-like acyl-CoA dehydrogenase